MLTIYPPDLSPEPPKPPLNRATIDFEAYSEGGYCRDKETGKWTGAAKGKKGISLIGSHNYASHPSTRILSLAYDLHDGNGIQLWFPGCPPPVDLIRHVLNGGIIEAHNSIFEYWLWNIICVKEFKWPPLKLEQMNCTAVRSVSTGTPRALKDIPKAVDLPVKKMDIGEALIETFCVPHNKKTIKYQKHQLHEYCIQDVKTEAALSDRVPLLSAHEHAIWQMDQKINDRGVRIDVEATKILAERVEKYVAQAGRDLAKITDGRVSSPREAEKIGKWLEDNGVQVRRTKKKNFKLDKDAVDDLFLQVHRGSPQWQVLDLRRQFSLASVDKLKAMVHSVSSDGRLRGLFWYYGAHTGRWTSMGVQLQNLARGTLSAEDVHRIIEEIKAGNWSSVEGPRPLEIISSLIRGLFIAAPGCELISSDFSAIEGRGQTMLAGEEWRIEVFKGDGKIYERTAADITKRPFQELDQYFIDNNKHHPLRGIGKVGELASGYGGWINAWKRFGAGKYLKTDNEIKKAILTWREKSPCIVEMWGGQKRKDPYRWAFTPELFGLEGAIVTAIQNPDHKVSYKSISFVYNTKNDALWCLLPSGRKLWYREPRLTLVYDKYAEFLVNRIQYRSFSKKDGWHLKDTYGGRMFENIVQAVCRDIMADAMLRLESARYPIVIHVHDEPVMEVPKGWGSCAEVKEIMEQRSGWYSDWPIVADSGWRGQRFRK